jgi:flagellin-like protein
MVLKQKKAISPVITTVLLVLVAIVLAVIILLWARGLIKEKTMKFDEPIERSCENLNFLVSLSGDQISVVNQGDTPIYRLDARITSEGSSTVLKSSTLNLIQGFSGVISYGEAFTQNGKIEIIPVLLGQKEKSKNIEEYPCPEQYWQVIE